MQVTGKRKRLAGCLAALLVAASGAFGREPKPVAPFRYAGGTEKMRRNCAGTLEVNTEALVFKCPFGSIRIPFNAITLMQYRPNLSRTVRKLKIQWGVRPGRGGGKTNRYFTIVYNQAETTHVVVLQVVPLSMRPYLAEIELKSGKRVEVMGYEEYSRDSLGQTVLSCAKSCPLASKSGRISRASWVSAGVQRLVG